MRGWGQGYILGWVGRSRLGERAAVIVILAEEAVRARAAREHEAAEQLLLRRRVLCARERSAIASSREHRIKP